MRGRRSDRLFVGLLRPLLLASTLSGCAPEVPATLSGVVCPPIGTRVDRRGSQNVVYAGADPNDAGVCLVRRGDNGEERFLAGLFTQPVADEAGLRRGLANLFPLAIGRRTSFIWRSPVIGSPGELGTFQETWLVAGEAEMPVGRGTRPVWVVQREQQNVSGNEGRFAYRLEVRYAIDKSTGAPLSFSGRSTTRGGESAAVSAWTAVAISLP